MNWHSPIDLHSRQRKSLLNVGDLGQNSENVVKFCYKANEETKKNTLSF